MNLLMTEMRRALHRRAVRTLIAIAVAGARWPASSRTSPPPARPSPSFDWPKTALQ